MVIHKASEIEKKYWNVMIQWLGMTNHLLTYLNIDYYTGAQEFQLLDIMKDIVHLFSRSGQPSAFEIRIQFCKILDAMTSLLTSN